ncbi:MAG: AMP-binding protein [Bacteroidaceae bacterium]|nr:AMP-binding protein [Bacteroidaceae bacterium]
MERISLPKHIETALKTHWDKPAFSDYKGTTYTYKQVAHEIARIHVFFDACGIKAGDKIAICGKNSSKWAISCLAIMSYGAVVVPVLHEFKADNIHNIINHSEAKLFFVGENIWSTLDAGSMPNLLGVISIDHFSLVNNSDPAIRTTFDSLDKLFADKYPQALSQNDLMFVDPGADELAMINYTSGSTGFSKGVMLPYRSLENNHLFASLAVPFMKTADSIVSILPMAHMYGFSFEFFYEFTIGMHIYFLTRLPSPKVIFQAFQEIKPKLIVSVPLVIEKIVRKNVMPKLQTPKMRFLLKLPIIKDIIYKKIGKEMYAAFGGNFGQVIIGGAAFNQEVEQLLAKAKFPYTVGYGATECGPIITYTLCDNYVPGSCGKPAVNMEVKVLSNDPQNVAGEIICRGPNVMLGYYKNPEQTEQTIDKDGWMYTGDLGIIDAKGNLFIKGRSKNLLLGPSGQNIYPEEIEDKLNNMEYVCESIVIQENDKLYALVYPDMDLVQKNGLTPDAVETIMENNRAVLNKELPAYSQIAKVRIYNQEFEKTPKKSIKRFLYQK